MAVTPVGNPYVESSDLVANYPGASEALAERIDIVGVNPFANAAARDAAIPSPVQGQMCSLNDDNKGYRYDGSEWILFSGAGPGNFTNTATGTFSSGGINYKWVQFLASGDLIVDQAGFADVLVIAGGASGGAWGGGGGAGGVLSTNIYLPAATHTVTVGAGGAGGSGGFNGLPSQIGSYAITVGGGAGATVDDPPHGGSGFSGGSGGGGFDPGGVGGSGFSTFGNSGGAGAGGSGGGGGGGGAVGAAGPSIFNGGNGGAGTSNSITGSSVTRGGGGAGGGRSASGGSGGAGGSGGGGAGAGAGAGTAGSANTGSGGGGGGFNAGPGGAGGSGIVIVRVVV